jgi:hypothetical protein
MKSTGGDRLGNGIHLNFLESDEAETFMRFLAYVAQLSISCVVSAMTHNIWVIGFQNSVKTSRNTLI